MLTMWFNRKKPPPIRSLIGEGMVVRGDMNFTEGLRVDGQVFGDVVASGEGRSILVISDNARVHGRVSAAHVIINGEVHGPISSTEMLELQPRARVVGDVRYELLEMHTGALVEGELKPLKSADKPALKLAASNDA
jgi:cytoskeletal protein CcmA (bactofilin family)